jgi:hypothetical protein
MVSVTLIIETFEYVANNPCYWVFLEESSYHSKSYLSLSILLTFHILIFWVFRLIDPRREYTSFHGKKGPLGLEVP